MTKCQNTHKIIQWNCYGYNSNLQCAASINGLLPYAAKKPLKKAVTNQIWKTMINVYIHDTGLRALGGISILIREDVPQSKIYMNTHSQAIAVLVTLHKTVPICSLYIPPHDLINEKELNNLIKQLPKLFILMGDFISHNKIWRRKTMNKRVQILKKKIKSNNLCRHNEKFQTHCDTSLGTFSIINLNLSDLSFFIDHNWRVYKDLCSSNQNPNNNGKHPDRKLRATNNCKIPMMEF